MGPDSRDERGLEIVVCMKVIIDPEVPHHTFAIDKQAKRALPPVGLPPVFSPFDENALECALRIKDERECRVTVLSVGKTVPKSLMQTVMAAGADRAIAVEDPQLEDLDPFTTAVVLAASVRKAGDFDLVLTGRQAADWDAGLVWAGLAEHLDVACVTVAQRVELRHGEVIVERCVSDGVEVVESRLPALVTVSNEAGDLRNVALAALMEAKKREILRWSAADVGFEEPNGLKKSVMDLADLFLPVLEIVDRQMIEGRDASEKGRRLARRLAEDGLLGEVD
ncbi:MAG: electron transfer flavoprotein subunit beta/FixA family protein [Thermoleophilia bacterium]|nr:electron transfer flavoprotein subunit beta/FixA family protein [Thermoleophilia bacterium]